MKVLFGIPDVTHRELADLEISGIKALGHECHTIHFGPVSSKRGLFNKVYYTIRNAYNIRRALNNDQYDLLFLNSTFDFNAVIRDSITHLILKSTGIKIFLKFHGSDPDLLDRVSWYKKRLSHNLLKNIRFIGVLSSQERDALIQRGAGSQEIYIVKNPVNPSLFKRDETLRKKWGIGEKTFAFIFCARFLPFKGLLDALEAMKKVAQDHQDIHLFCIGDGPEMTKARRYVNANDLGSKVTFTGFIPESETRYFYSNGDALIFPSEHEGFPMAVFQSLAAGMPIITTRIAASADYLEEPENVLWVEFHNHIQIAECMNKLLTDSSLVTQMRMNNAEKAQLFTSDRNAAEYVNIFKEIINDSQDG